MYLMDSGFADKFFRWHVFDRVIMDHPTGAHDFLGVACRLVREGGFIHFYRVGGEEPTGDVVDLFRGAGCSVGLTGSRRVLPYSPRRYIWVYDVRVERHIS